MIIWKPKNKSGLKSKAQSAVELTLVLSLLLLLLTAMVEFGVLLNTYITVQDAARTGAREAAVADPIADSAKFFNNESGVPKIVRNALLPLELDPKCDDPAVDPCDDIVISVYSVTKGQTPKLVFDPVHKVFNNRSTQFTPAQIGARLDPAAPNTGLVVIEIYYSYRQLLNLPWMNPFENAGGFIPFRVFAIMPLSAAEPTPTPRP
jgi:hypothetical protein